MNNRSLYFLFICLFGGYFINPFLFYSASILSLFLSDFSKINTKTKWRLAFIAVSIGSLIYSSRLKGATYSDDFIGYYNDFIAVNISTLLENPTGRINEFGLPLLDILTKGFFGKVSQQSLMYMHSLIISVLLLFSLKSTLLKSTNKNIGMVLSITVAFFPFILTTQLIRQAYSIPFVIYALFGSKLKLRVWSTGLSLVFHSSSILYYILFSPALLITGKNFFNLLSVVAIPLLFSNILFTFVFSKLVQTDYAQRVSFLYRDIQSQITELFIIMNSALFIIAGITFYYLRIRHINVEKSFYINIYLLSVNLMVLMQFSNLGYFPYRFSILFNMIMGYILATNLIKWGMIGRIGMILGIFWQLAIIARSGTSTSTMALWHDFGIFDIPLLSFFK